MNFGVIQAYLISNFKEDTPENRKKVIEYLKDNGISGQDLKYLGQYWVDCIFFYKNSK
jgi:hypothetical protein